MASRGFATGEDETLALIWASEWANSMSLEGGGWAPISVCTYDVLVQVLQTLPDDAMQPR